MKTKTTLESLLKKGDYSYVNENIQKLFKTEPIRGELGVKCFNKVMSSEEVIAEFQKEGLRPMNATELFYWASQNKDFGKDGWKYVVALGSEVTFGGKRRVCDADFYGAERKAYLRWFDSDWDGGAFFGFFRESSDIKASALKLLDTLTLEHRVERLEKLFNPEILK